MRRRIVISAKNLTPEDRRYLLSKLGDSGSYDAWYNCFEIWFNPSELLDKRTQNHKSLKRFSEAKKNKDLAFQSSWNGDSLA